MATSTPWGPSQTTIKIAPGITFYSTAGHGGYKLSAGRMTEMPAAFSQSHPNPWFEEDCEWAMVVLSFPVEFLAHYGAEQFQKWNSEAEATLRRWFPEVWESFFGRELQPGESMVKDQHHWDAANVGNFVVRGAWGSWHENVPENMVGVCARRAIDGVEKFFLIPEKDYNNRTAFGFAIESEKAANFKEWSL